MQVFLRNKAKVAKAEIKAAARFALAQDLDRMPCGGCFVLIRTNGFFSIYIETKTWQAIGNLAKRQVVSQQFVGKIVP